MQEPRSSLRRFVATLVVVAGATAVLVTGAGASTPGGDVRLTNDCLPFSASNPNPDTDANGNPVNPLASDSCPTSGGYITNYAMNGSPSGAVPPDPVISECSVARGRQNEPAVAVDPRNTSVLLGSSNDYCGVYATRNAQGVPVALGPIWLGYYRSENGGSSFQSSLVPGYPGDNTPFASLSGARTASAGDPVIAWDNHGRAFFGSESSDDPSGSPKTFGDVFVARFENPGGAAAADTTADGKRYKGTTIVSRGSSAPNLLGVFNDKTAIEVDRTAGKCEGNVYFAYSRFTGNGTNAIYFSRSTDHGITFSNVQKITESIHGVQFPDISVTSNGHVYVTFRQFESVGRQTDNVVIVKSTSCGQTFQRPQVVTDFIHHDAQDVLDPEPVPTPTNPATDEPFGGADKDVQGNARDCGDFSSHCKSGYTFFRRDTQVRSTADQLDAGHEWVYIVYDPTKPGTQVDTGTTYGSIEVGKGSQSGIFFVRWDGATGKISAGPTLIDPQALGHQTFPDISADGGVLHTLWWDSRNDPCYSPTRPIGNCVDAAGHPTGTVPSLDVYAATSTDAGAHWHGVTSTETSTKVTDVMSNPNYEQFSNRTVPFAGDYLWVTSLGDFSYGVWTDWRNTRQGTDPREATEDEDNTTADVFQCRKVNSSTDKKGNVSKSFSGDLCPHAGGLDQNIYGDHTP